MPLINIKLSAEHQGKVDLPAMADKIINLTEKILKKDRDVTVVMIDRSDELGFYTIGNKVCSFIVNLNITKDTNTDEQKAVWLQSVDHYISKSLGLEVEDSVNYITIHEQDGDSWGYNGVTQAMRAEQLKGRGL